MGLQPIYRLVDYHQRSTTLRTTTTNDETQKMTTATKPKTRTVALTPIAHEVADYVAWLRSEGFRVIQVKESRACGVDTLVTFEC